MRAPRFLRLECRDGSERPKHPDGDPSYHMIGYLRAVSSFLWSTVVRAGRRGTYSHIPYKVHHFWWIQILCVRKYYQLRAVSSFLWPTGARWPTRCSHIPQKIHHFCWIQKPRVRIMEKTKRAKLGLASAIWLVMRLPLVCSLLYSDRPLPPVAILPQEKAGCQGGL